MLTIQLKTYSLRKEAVTLFFHLLCSNGVEQKAKRSYFILISSVLKMSLFIPSQDVNLTKNKFNKNSQGFITPNSTTDFARADICITSDDVWYNSLTQGYSHLSGMETISLLNSCCHSASEFLPFSLSLGGAGVSGSPFSQSWIM